MTVRRTFLFAAMLAPTALSSCHFSYDVSELVGHYRADASRIGEALTLFPDQTYLHAWNSEAGPVQQEGGWRLGGNWIHLNRYVQPGYSVGVERVFIPGPPTFFLFGGPTFFSRELDLEFVRVRGLERG